MKTSNITEIEVGLASLTDIVFDRFFDHSKEQRPPEQKFYLIEGNKIVLPVDNMIAFLYNQKGQSCTTSFEGKKRGEYIRVGQSHTIISPAAIPFLDEKGKQICFDEFDGKRFYVHLKAPTTKLSGGSYIKQEAQPRPVLSHPWFLNFHITLIKNNLIDSQKLYNWFERGGIEIAIGNHRPLFGRFKILKWDVSK